MPYARSSIPDFELANPLYIGATITFYTVDVNGIKTSTMANLYSDTIGPDLLPNPQVLDSYGKFTVPVYIQDPVIGTIITVANSVPAHDTGIISNDGQVRGPYTINTLYYGNDLIQDAATGIVYYGTQTFLSVSLANDIAQGNLAVFLTPPDLSAGVSAAAAAAAAANSATAAAASASTSATGATAAAASASAASSSATSTATSATSAATSATAAAASATTAAAAAAAASGGPQGRLSLTSGISVMPNDAVAQSTLYYVPERGDRIPIYNGASFANSSISSVGSQLSMSLDSNASNPGYQQSGNLFDIFAFVSSGVPKLGTGPSWASLVSRGSGAGTTELQVLNGLWVNKNAILLKIDTTGSRISVAVNQATYLGTMYATANGQCSMQFYPTPVVGGSNNILGLYNAYNRVNIVSQVGEASNSWSYGASAWRSANGSNNNRVSFVDGLQKAYPVAEITQYINCNNEAQIGINFDSATNTPLHFADIISTINVTATTLESSTPLLGFHYVQAMENAAFGTHNYFGGPRMAFRFRMEM